MVYEDRDNALGTIRRLPLAVDVRAAQDSDGQSANRGVLAEVLGRELYLSIRRHRNRRVTLVARQSTGLSIDRAAGGDVRQSGSAGRSQRFKDVHEWREGQCRVKSWIVLGLRGHQPTGCVHHVGSTLDLAANDGGVGSVGDDHLGSREV